MIVGFDCFKASCSAVSRRYKFDLLSYCNPNVVSKVSHTVLGNHNSVMLESINANSGSLSSFVSLPSPEVVEILLIVTTLSRKLSPVIVNTTLFGTNRLAS